MGAIALSLVLLATVASGQTTANKFAGKPAQDGKGQGSFVFWNMAPGSVDFLLQHVPQNNPDRLRQLRQLFTYLQCPASELREQSTLEEPNLLCTLPASTPTGDSGSGKPGTILFLAHYQHEGSGLSAIENWTGAIMLAFIYHALSATPRHHTFVFAAVDGEAGAKALFDSFSHTQRRALLGVVELDALGLGPTRYYVDPNDISPNPGWSWISHELDQAAEDQHLVHPYSAPPGDWFRVDDTRAFRHSGIPSILIHSVSWHSRRLPGSVHDTVESINRDEYLKTITFLDVYAIELDQAWPTGTGDFSSTPSGGRRR